MRKILIIALFTGCFSLTANAASFDCSKASSTTEKLICGDESISKLDEQLASSYKQALEAATDKDAVKKQQIEWLKQQRVCKDVECLANAYQERINQLSVLSTSVVGQNSSAQIHNEWVLARGGEFKLCNLLYDLVANKHKAKELRQSVDPLLAIKGVTVPVWEEISAEEYISILDPSVLTDSKAIAVREELRKSTLTLKTIELKLITTVKARMNTS